MSHHHDGRALSVKCEGIIKYLYEASDTSINFESKRFPISHSFDEIQSYSDTENSINKISNEISYNNKNKKSI